MTNQIEKKRNTLLVDATYLLKKSFLGDTNTYTAKFGHIGGLLNFFLTLRTLCLNHNINKVVLCWDSPNNNSGKLRYNIYPNYKSNRDKEWNTNGIMTDKEIEYEEKKKVSFINQRIRVQKYSEELFFRTIQSDLCEGDDLIAQYVINYHEIENILVYTNDRDICQTIGIGANVFLANLKKIITKDNYFLNFDHHYSNLLTLKIFAGDSGDGVVGLSQVTYETMLKLFPDMKTKTYSVDDVLTEIENRVKLLYESNTNKKKQVKIPQVYTNILNGIDKKKVEHGIELYDIHKQIMDLTNPLLTREARHELRENSELPLNDEDRGSKNLRRLMQEDDFLTVYRGDIDSFSKPFYPTILFEKGFYKKSLLNE